MIIIRNGVNAFFDFFVRLSVFLYIYTHNPGSYDESQKVTDPFHFISFFPEPFNGKVPEAARV
jgi:hypothetical protein